MNFFHGFWSIGVAAAGLIAGLALCRGFSWRWVLIACALASLVPALLFLLPTKGDPFPAAELKSASRVWQDALAVVACPRFWRFFLAIFVAGGGEFALTFWSASLVREEFGGSALAGGAVTAAFSLGMIVGRMGPLLLKWKIDLFRWLMWSGLAGVGLGMLLFAVSGVGWVFFLLFLLGVATGPFWPSLQSYCVEVLPHLDATTVFILLSCSGVPGCGFFAWLTGALGDRFSLHAALLLVPACYLLMLLLIGADRLRQRKMVTG